MEKHYATDTDSVIPQDQESQPKAAPDESSEPLEDVSSSSEGVLSNADNDSASSEQEAVSTEESASDMQAALDQAQEEARNYQDRLTRLAAEFDNYKKRTSREFGVLVKNATESLIFQLLPTLDSIERALQAPQTTKETRSFAQGIEIIRQQLQDTLRKEGLQEIDASGQPFDPTKHEAIMAIDRDDQPAETIVNEVEKGYMLNDKILRPSKVVVSRSPAQTISDDMSE